jgi:hypothetical protein
VSCGNYGIWAFIGYYRCLSLFFGVMWLGFLMDTDNTDYLDLHRLFLKDKESEG